MALAENTSCKNDLQQREGIRSYALFTYTQMIHFTPSVREKILPLSFSFATSSLPYKSLSARFGSCVRSSLSPLRGFDFGCARSSAEPPPCLPGRCSSSSSWRVVRLALHLPFPGTGLPAALCLFFERGDSSMCNTSGQCSQVAFMSVTLFFWSMTNLSEASSYPGSLCPVLTSPAPCFPRFIYSLSLTVYHNPATDLSLMAIALSSAEGQLCKALALSLPWYLLDMLGGMSPTLYLLLRNF